MCVRKIAKIFMVSLAMLAGATGHAQQASSLRVIVFPGGFNWPLWVAKERGFFAAQNLEVELTNTPNSVFQMSGLIDGKFDIAMTAMDNVVAYNEGQGESGITKRADLIAVLGADSGFLRLVGGPAVSRVEELKGRKLAVDALTTGYAFVLREILARHGLRDGDYQWVQAGGVKQRFEGLMQNQFDATLLVSPFELQAQAAGYRVLAIAASELGRYQGVVAAVRRDWAAQRPQEIARFIKAYREALAWLYAPANKDQAIAVLRKNLPALNEQAAAGVYSVLLNPHDGFTPDARIDMEGVQSVLQLRQKYGPMPLENPIDASRYVDLRYQEAAAPESSRLP